MAKWLLFKEIYVPFADRLLRNGPDPSLGPVEALASIFAPSDISLSFGTVSRLTWINWNPDSASEEALMLKGGDSR